MKDNPAGGFGGHCPQGKVANFFPWSRRCRKNLQDKGDYSLGLCMVEDDSLLGSYDLTHLLEMGIQPVQPHDAALILPDLQGWGWT